MYFKLCGELRAPICLVCCNKIDEHNNQIIVMATGAAAVAAVAYIVVRNYRQIDWAVNRKRNKIKSCRVRLFLFISIQRACRPRYVIFTWSGVTWNLNP